MDNVKMTYAEMKALEKDLHRELTNAEAVYGYTNGWKALLNDYMHLDDKTYVNYRRLLELVITYFTKGKLETYMLLKEKDFSGVLPMLEDLLTLLENNDDEKEGFDLSDGDNEESNPECFPEYSIDDIIDMLIEAIPDCEIHWLEQYRKVDENAEVVTKFVRDLEEDEETYNPDEIVGDFLDLIKDTVVERLAVKLKTTGEKMKLHEEIIEEVCDYLFNNYNNVSIKIVNNEISVK